LNVLLYRYSGEKDLLVGYPFYGRTLPEIENLVGYFVNILVLRTDLSANPTFREVLGRVRETHFEAIENADVPFAKVVTEVHPVRDPSRNPIFQVGFTWLMPPQPMEFPGTSITPYRVDRGAARFDMEFVLRDLADHVEGHVEYNTDLFDPQTISRFIENFKTLLEGAIEHRDLRISDLPLLRERERKQILVEWNATEAEYPRDKCVHQLFEEQVERSPEAVALVFGEERLTYEDLNSRANQVARHLQGLGVGPDDLVGICMERSMDMVVGILGILKAGGAYVPLDPEYPKDRLAFMLQDAGASVLLTQRSLDAVLPAHEAKTIRLDEDGALISECSKENPNNPSSSKNLSHVIYTSGSTGKPKGVAIEHRSVVALLSWAKAFFDPGDFAGVLASTSFCFDLSVFEMFAPLISGGKVILAENALELPSLRAAEEVTLINTVPSAITELVRLKGFPSSVRTVCLAGEPLTTDLVKAIYGCASVERVFDLYGPSEDTTYSTYALRKADGPATIGRPIANTQVYLLDANQQPVPVGVPGELHLAGAGLARGYLNRPELTAEKFVPNPFREEPGARMYKTGDLARYREDGNIEFLGRLDHQVKIRGYRIELGEIESVLDSHSKIRKSVVLAREDTPGEKRLVAYLVGEGEPQPTVSELRTFLKAKLPDYMVPSAFVFLEEFPLTPNGKIDRNALPEPDTERPELEEAYVAPRTETEKTLARIWSEILGIDPIGVQDDFFEIGGHSLATLRVVSKIDDIFHTKLSRLVVFERRTIESLSRLLEENQTRSVSREKVSTTRMDTEGGVNSSSIASPSDTIRIAPPSETQSEKALHGLEIARERLERIKVAKGKPGRFRMRKSKIAKYLIRPLFRIPKRRVRLSLQSVIAWLEGGEGLSLTLRELYKAYFDIEVGNYTVGCFDYYRYRSGTRVGRYCVISATSRSIRANHPSNTLSPHPFFYEPALGIAKSDPEKIIPHKTVQIGNDVYIGPEALFLYPTEKIGDGAIVGNRAVVSGDVPSFAIVTGFPAEVVRYRFPKEVIKLIQESAWWEKELDDLAVLGDELASPLFGDGVR
jgi:amino acid adenylation domain-containing protein